MNVALAWWLLSAKDSAIAEGVGGRTQVREEFRLVGWRLWELAISDAAVSALRLCGYCANTWAGGAEIRRKCRVKRWECPRSDPQLASLRWAGRGLRGCSSGCNPLTTIWRGCRLNRSAIPYPEPYRSGVITLANTERSRELLNKIYVMVVANKQRDVENVITYDYSEAESFAATAPEAWKSESITHHYWVCKTSFARFV